MTRKRREKGRKEIQGFICPQKPLRFIRDGEVGVCWGGGEGGGRGDGILYDLTTTRCIVISRITLQ